MCAARHVATYKSARMYRDVTVFVPVDVGRRMICVKYPILFRWGWQRNADVATFNLR